MRIRTHLEPFHLSTSTVPIRTYFESRAIGNSLAGPNGAVSSNPIRTQNATAPFGTDHVEMLLKKTAKNFYQKGC